MVVKAVNYLSIRVGRFGVANATPKIRESLTAAYVKAAQRQKVPVCLHVTKVWNERMVLLCSGILLPLKYLFLLIQAFNILLGKSNNWHSFKIVL